MDFRFKANAHHIDRILDIRLHMGPDKNTYPDPFSETAKIYPSVVAIFTSDIESAYILEEKQ